MYIQHTHMWPHMSMYVYIHVPTITICTFFEFQKKKVEEDFSTFYIHVFMCTCTCSTSTYMYLQVLLLLRYKLLVQTTNKLQTTKGVYTHIECGSPKIVACCTICLTLFLFEFLDTTTITLCLLFHLLCPRLEGTW